MTFELADELARFDPSLPIEAARTPPASWYRSAAFLEAEADTVFRDSWIYAGPASKVREPGSFLTAELLGEPWVVVRDAAGTLRAFANSCRHHAARVALGEGVAEELVCPYHGWTYQLDGRLRRAPQLGRTEAFDPATCRLPEYPVRELGPLLFVYLGDEPRPPEDDLSELISRFDASGWNDLTWVARRTYEMECNWKVFADNYLDGGYHIAHLHSGLDAQLDMQSYRTQVFERWSLQTAGSSGDDAPSNESIDFAERIGDGALYAYVYPNLAINRYGPVLDTNFIRPISADKTEVVFDYWYQDTKGPEAQAFIEKSLEASDQVQQEDVDICREVQRGLASRSYDRGVYAGVETAMLAFHRLLAADLAKTRLA